PSRGSPPARSRYLPRVLPADRTGRRTRQSFGLCSQWNVEVELDVVSPCIEPHRDRGVLVLVGEVDQVGRPIVTAPAVLVDVMALPLCYLDDEQHVKLVFRVPLRRPELGHLVLGTIPRLAVRQVRVLHQDRLLSFARIEPKVGTPFVEPVLDGLRTM